MPKVEQMMHDAREDLLTFTGFPVAGRRSGSPTRSSDSTRDVRRRTNVVGVFPNPAALLRLAGAVLSKPTTNGRSPIGATFPKDTHGPAPRPAGRT